MIFWAIPNCSGSLPPGSWPWSTFTSGARAIQSAGPKVHDLLSKGENLNCPILVPPWSRPEPWGRLAQCWICRTCELLAIALICGWTSRRSVIFYCRLLPICDPLDGKYRFWISVEWCPWRWRRTFPHFLHVGTFTQVLVEAFGTLVLSQVEDHLDWRHPNDHKKTHQSDHFNHRVYIDVYIIQKHIDNKVKKVNFAPIVNYQRTYIFLFLFFHS